MICLCLHLISFSEGWIRNKRLKTAVKSRLGTMQAIMNRKQETMGYSYSQPIVLPTTTINWRYFVC